MAFEWWRLLSGPLVMAAAATFVAGAEPVPGTRPAISALAISDPPRLDGVLDDPCWQGAAALINFTQVLPREGEAPTERTEVQFAYTRDCLYVAVHCFDREPGRIIATDMRRDGDFDTDDRVTIAFDTFNLAHDGYFFSVNPLGARADGLIQDFSKERFEWDAIWDARARTDSSGWTIEVAIPFKSVSFNRAHDAWGCNIERVIRRKQETVRWTALSPAKSATTLADFGQLQGLVGMRQGYGLEIRPFASLRYRVDAANDGHWKFKPGADLTYRITPSLTANATFNTDFAEAEVDERIVNLSRFPVFFPEKRDFFLQDSSLFSFGGLDESLTPYYSRRIGLGVDGQPVDIIAGGRLTGRIGDTQVALLDVQQEGHGGVPSKNLFVGRLSTGVLKESYVGMLVTHGDPRIDGDNTLAGLDFNYRNSRLAGGKQLLAHAWGMGTDSDRFQSRDAAFGGDLDFPNEPLDAHVSFTQIGNQFDPALGFVRRRGIRNYVGTSKWTWRPNTERLRSVSLFTRWDFITDLDDRIVGEDNDYLILSLVSPAEDEIEIGYGTERDVVDDPFEIQPGIIIPPGDYRDSHIFVNLESSEARPVSGRLEYRYGTFYTGYTHEYEAAIDWRPSRHLNTGVGYELTEVRLAEGDFDVHIVTWRLNVGFTPSLTWSTLVQYDNISDDIGLNSRIRWTWQPGNDLFFVVNQGWDFADWRFQQLQTEVTLKVGVTFRF